MPESGRINYGGFILIDMPAMPLNKKEPETIGERLRKRREALGLSVEDLAREVYAPQKYVRALEEDEYQVFPAKVYAQGFLKKILEEISFEDGESLIKEFNIEWEVRTFRRKKENNPLPENRGREPYVTPKSLGFAAAGFSLILLLVFLGYGIIGFVGSPRLEIESPLDQTAFDGPEVLVQGKAEKESRLTVNGREIKIDETGRFSEDIELGAGPHALEFVVLDRFGRESRVVRYVLVK